MIPRQLARIHSAYAIGGFDAGNAMYALYPAATQIFPVLPKSFELLPDTPAGTFGIAWYMGLSSFGKPRFAVRDDSILSPKVAWHEAGHALEQVLVNRRVEQFGGTYYSQEDHVRGSYWLWREFPGTWREAYLFAEQMGLTTPGGWAYLPGESVAESISAAVGGYVHSEWTATYGKDLAINSTGQYDPSGGGMSARVFWLQLMAEVDMDEATVRRIADQSAQEAVERYAVAARDTGFTPLKDAFNDHKHGYLKDTSAGTLETTTSGPILTLGNE